jgi:hypothetical protein
MNSAPAKTAVGEAGPQILHQRHAVSVFHTQQLRVGCGMRQQDVMGAAADPGLVLLIGGKPETPRPFGFHPLVPVPFGQRRGEPRRRRQHQRVSRDGIGLQVAECEPWRLPAGQGAAQPDLTDMHQACSQCRRQRSHTFFHGGNGLQAGSRGSLLGRLRVGPLPASSAESAYDHVDIAGNSPHRQLGHHGGISRAHRPLSQLIPHRDVLAAFIPGSSDSTGPLSRPHPSRRR